MTPPFIIALVAILSAIGGILKLLWDAAQFFKGMRDDLHYMREDVDKMMTNHLPHVEQCIHELNINMARVFQHLGLEKE